MNSKYSGFLTVLLVLIIIAIVGIIAFLGFKFYTTNVAIDKSSDFVDAFGDQIGNNTESNTSKPGGSSSSIPTQSEDDEENDDDKIISNVAGEEQSGGGNSSTKPNKGPQYNGFITAGTIEIPATKLKCPVLARSEYSPKALETAVVELYGPGLNQVGITTISGHNYRNKTFFSDNKKLTVGDKIFITDLTGKRLSYTIYDKFQAEENYSDYMVKDTQGAIEVALSTCTDDAKARIIILARADV